MSTSFESQGAIPHPLLFLQNLRLALLLVLRLRLHVLRQGVGLRAHVGREAALGSGLQLSLVVGGFVNRHGASYESWESFSACGFALEPVFALSWK